MSRVAVLWDTPAMDMYWVRVREGLRDRNDRKQAWRCMRPGGRPRRSVAGSEITDGIHVGGIGVAPYLGRGAFAFLRGLEVVRQLPEAFLARALLLEDLAATGMGGALDLVLELDDVATALMARRTSSVGASCWSRAVSSRRARATSSERVA